MGREKKGNGSVIFCIISIMLCVLLLIGATIAWFTDTETNTGNKIQAGTLDVDVVWYEVDDANITSTGYVINEETYYFSSTANDFDTEDAMISDDEWQPGEVNAKLIEVTNNGSLDMDIQLNAIVEDVGLEDALWFDFIAVDGSTTTGTFTERAMYTLSEFVSSLTFELEGKAEDEDAPSLQFILVYGMLESAGNTYQGTSYTADIILTATQKDATDMAVYAYDIEDINGASTNQTVILMTDITSDTPVTLSTNVNFDLNGYTLTVPSFTMTTKDYCTVDISGGTIYATSDDIIIDIENGTLNYASQTLQVGTNYKVDVTVSENTVTYSGVVNFYEVSSSGGITTATVVVNEGVKVVINEEAIVTANIETTDGETYVLENNGVLNGIATGATYEDDVVKIRSALQLYDFLTSGTEENAVLGNDITYDTGAYGIMYVTSTKDLDLNGYTITIPNDVTTKNRPINLKTGASFTIHGGSFICGTLATGETSTTNGSYGAIESASGVSDVTLNIYDMEFSNAHYNALCVRVYSGTTATITNTVFNSAVGGAINTASSAVANVYSNTITLSNYNSYNTSAVAAMYSGVINVYSGTYSGEGYGAYVFSSGGTINIYGGTWQGDKGVLKADKDSTSYPDAVSIINVYDGTFDGSILTSGEVSINIRGGTFSNTGLTLEAFEAYVPEGYTATETSTGIYTVTAD